MSEEKNSPAKRTIGCLLFAVFVFLGGPFALLGVDYVYQQTKAYELQKEEELAEKKIAKKIPKGTVQRLKYNLKQALGDSKRSKQAIEIQTLARNIEVDFFVRDDITSSTAKKSIKTDIAETMKAIKKSGYPFHYVTVKVWCEITNMRGDKKKKRLVEIHTNKATLYQKNWDEYITEEDKYLDDEFDTIMHNAQHGFDIFKK